MVMRLIRVLGHSLFNSESQPYRHFYRGVDMSRVVDLQLPDGFERGLRNESRHSSVMRLSSVHQEWVTEVDVSR